MTPDQVTVLILAAIAVGAILAALRDRRLEGQSKALFGVPRKDLSALLGQSESETNALLSNGGAARRMQVLLAAVLRGRKAM